MAKQCHVMLDSRAGSVDAPVPVLPATRLAVVEDDDELRERIMLPALQEAGFQTTGLASALDLYRRWVGNPFDMVLLDVGLPDDDGVEIARHLLGLTPRPAVLVYTGNAMDRLRGLRAGVDAYLVKPLDMDEVVETLRNVRRKQLGLEMQAPASGWSLGRQGWCLRTPAGVTVMLSQAERQIMGVLLANPGRPVRRESLISNLTCDIEEFDPHRLEMLVYRLRRKCMDAAGEALPLCAIRGVGYMFG